ncbi:PREDICTED: CCR4-NOT transcription complex subunit 1 isoform X2 [Tarenaya hassleriana]|uniref:CCR4-NOT transcription complex subunit 1 isoform X2 n=1 Tax=Tarenaya hassleriana TaxID=28532 RepID=UPI00053C7A94|nr:PREDICTED: CCR4-NOT transcription complex subunit 1 isoform X2 [Tarenaya hassleriana]
MVPPSSSIATHVRFLLESLSDSDVDSAIQELREFVDRGVEASVPVLATCLGCLTFKKSQVNRLQLEKVVSPVFKHAMKKPNFGTTLSQALKDVEVTEDFVDDLANALCLSTSEKIGFGLALSDLERSDARTSGRNFCATEIEKLCANPVQMESTQQIHDIILFICQSEDLSKHLDSFLQILSSAQSRDELRVVLTPILSEDVPGADIFRSMDFLNDTAENDFDDVLAEIEKEISVGDLIEELGYGFTADAGQCKEILSRFLPLTEATISRILGTVARSYAGLEDNHNTFSTFSLALDCCTSTELPELRSWNVEILIETIRQLAPGTNWIRVIENLDYDEFYIPNMEAFSFFMLVFRNAWKDPFPLHAICSSVWKNVEGQLSFLKHAISAQAEVFSFVHSARKLAYVDNGHGHDQQLVLANHAWLSLDLLDVLCQLAERGHAALIRSLLDYPLTHCPRTLLLGMAHVKTAYNLIQRDVASAVLPMILKNTPDSGFILNLWHLNAELVLWGILDAQNLESEGLMRLMETCHELKILSFVLESVPFSRGIRLAILASQRGFLDIEKWLSSCLYMYKNVFFEECLKFIKDIHFGESKDFSVKHFHPSGTIFNLYLEATSSVLKVLKAHANVISSPQLSEEIEKVHAAILDCNLELQNGGALDSPSSDVDGDDVEAEANAYFHQMFSGQLSVEAMVQMLARYKDSPVEREKAIFECMIGNLFEEYRFFPKYPERQLKIAAILFGSVIKHQLIASITLGIALRGVLDALRKPADSKMFLFGTKALEQFVNRLIELPQYCNHILQISHLRGTHPELVAVIEQALARISSGHSEADASVNHPISPLSFPGNGELSGSGIGQSVLQLTSSIHHQQRNEVSVDDRNKVPALASNDVKPLLPSSVTTSGDVSVIQKNPVTGLATSSTSAGFARSSRGATSTRFGSALNIETLVAAAEKREQPIEAAPSEVQDKISFIINNISAANMESKAKEFAEVLPQQYYPWFAQYMVMKRASIEPNFHDLYLKFLDKVNSKALNKEIVQATYENCKVLLSSDLIKSSSEERSLLKNLGSWLGKLTIGRNHVLLAREIDPKSLIVEAYEKGLMIAVIPFTSKVLEPCHNSIAYQPPNPWTMGILGLLAEIYSMPNLKMNLKFDIEVLFKNLGVDMKEVAPTSLLKDRKRETDGNPDFSSKDLGVAQVSQPQMLPEAKSGAFSPLNQVELALDVTSSPNTGNHSKLLSQYPAPLQISAGTSMDDEKVSALSLSDKLPSAQGLFQSTPSPSAFSINQLSAAIPNIGNHVIINQKLSAYGLHFPFQRAVPIAMDRAIKDIVSGIVQRSVCIACQTTKELVLKDYALEPDETRIYNAAHLMVASLAGSLAHVTCKEPLRSSISNHLLSSLQGVNITSEVLEQIVQLVTNDNLDLGCAAIEQAATEKAIQTIDGDIAQQLLLRRKHRDGVGSSFFDPNMLSQNSVSVIPESLRPKPGHLSLSQQRVYEDFVQLPWQKQSTQSSHGLSAVPSSSGEVGIGGGYGSLSGKQSSGISSSAANVGMDMVSRSSDISVEGFESSSVAPPSVPSVQVGPASDAATLLYSKPLSSSESYPTESADGVSKETGVSLQTLSSSATMERLGSSITQPSLSTRDALDKYQIVTQKLEDLVASNSGDSEIQAVVSEVPEIILRCVSRDEAALAVAQKAFKALYENATSSLHVSANLGILAAVRDVCKRVVKELTSWVLYSDEERKLNKDITVGLIRSELLNLAEYNVHMAKHLDGGRNKSATDFAITLLQSLVSEESSVISELHSLVDALAKLAAKPGSPESLQHLIDMIRNPVASSASLSSAAIGIENGARQSKDEKTTANATTTGDESTIMELVERDPDGFRGQVSLLFENWYKICELPGANDAACTRYVIQLHQSGLLKGDDLTESFFRILTDLSVAHCISSEVISSAVLQTPQQSQGLSFLAIDIYAKLVFSILKNFPDQESSGKFFLLSKILAVTVRHIQKNAEEKKTSFNPRPYFRLFINWLLDFCSLDPATDGSSFQILTAFANAFHALQPFKVPAFSFAWLELVSHRSFMPKLLTVNNQKGWPYVQRLLVDLLQFLEPFLRNAELGGPVHVLYKGTLRVLLVLLHDFPEFLCDYHFTFCDVIPPSCIQMRNIILSSFPRNMRLPDPSTPNLKIDLLPEIVDPPRILSEVDAALKAKQMKNDVDEYLMMRPLNSPFLNELKERVLLPITEASSAGTRYNVPLINSLVLYVGMQAIQQLQAGASQAQSNANVAALQIFKYLSSELDAEGRYLFLNAIANQLRYPNNHTHYFSFIMLYLFHESDEEIIQEQITRVLLERLIVNRPHPWGLLITFIELIRNPRYNFWKQGFIRCAPEIEKLFESVARSCGGGSSGGGGALKPVDEAMVTGWVSDSTH